MIAVFALCWCVPLFARAQEPTPVTPPVADALQAKAKRELGRQLMIERRFEDALAALKEAHRLEPGAAVVLTIADTYRYLAQREEKAAKGLQDPAERADRQVRAETMYRDAFNWVVQAMDFPMTENDRRDSDSLRGRITPQVALIEVATTPEAAAVQIDGEAWRNRKSVAVPPGIHRVFVQVPGHKDAETEVTARPGEVSSVRLALERLFAPVRIESQPPGAKVEIVGGARAEGTTPFATTTPVSTLRVSVSLDGYLPQTREVSVLPGEGATLTIKLERAQSTLATLSVNGNPKGALVSVDGRALGEMPLSFPSLEPGSGQARVLVSSPGHVSWSDLVSLEPGAATRIQVELPRSRTPLTLGWKIAGYGGAAVLAAACGGFTIWAVREREAFERYATTERLDTINHLNITAGWGVGFTQVGASARWVI